MMNIEQFAAYCMTNDACITVVQHAASGTWTVDVNALVPMENIWGDNFPDLQAAIDHSYKTCLTKNNWRPHED